MLPRVFAFDTETKLIAPGLNAPPLACLQFIDSEEAQAMGDYWPAAARIYDRHHAASVAHYMLDSGVLIVGHNVSFDWAVLCALDGTLLPKVFQAYAENRITDTMYRQKLADIARGRYRTMQYNLGAVGQRHGFGVDKEDPWRLRYGELLDVPLEHWPDEALSYALDDPRATLAAYIGQATRYDPAWLVDEFAQARRFFALDLCSTWGIRTSPRGVTDLEAGTRAHLEDLRELLQDAGLVRTDKKCSRNTKAAKDLMREVCAELGVEPALTKSGDICLDSDACRSSGDPLLESYSEYSSMQKVLSNDVEALRKGIYFPIHTNFDLADTGRSTSASPNIQNPRRLPGVRECFVPRGFEHAS